MCKAVAAAGIYAQYLNAAGAPGETPAQIKAGGIDFLIPDKVTTAQNIANMQAAGITVWVYTVNNRADRDAALAKGVTGIISDDCWGITGTFPRDSVSDFSTGYLWPLANPIDSANIKLGGAIRAVSFTYAGAGQGGIRFGQFGEGPATSRIRFTAQFLAGASDQTRWLSVWVGSAAGDEGFKDAATPGTVDGYNFLIRRSGAKAIYKRSNGSTIPALLGEHASTPFAAAGAEGRAVKFEILIDATGVKLRCLTDGTESSTTDTTYRGTTAILSMWVNGTGVAFSEIGISR